MKNIQQVKISVVIPSFERVQSLREAIESVLRQTFIHFEIIVVNDSSNEKPIIDLINSLNDSRIKYLRNERKKGGNGARNTGILNAKGKYIAFLDDDDEWLEDKLEDQYNSLESNKENFAGVWSDFLILKNDKWIKNISRSLPDNFIKEIVSDQISIGTSSNLLLKKEIAISTLFDENLERYQDIDFLIRILRKNRLKHLDKVHFKYYPGKFNNPYILERATKLFLRKIRPELNSFSVSEKRKLFAHKYYSLAKMFSENGKYMKTFKSVIQIYRYRPINPLTVFKLLLKSVINHAK